MQKDKHKKARKILEEIDRNPENYFIIHYSCESFYNLSDGRTPRITSIAIYSYGSGQTESFSIHKCAEKLAILPDKIEQEYDKLESKMLEEYFQFVKEHKNMKWIHWNMRDINYGFKAIEHRFEVLEGTPVQIEDSNKIDLSRLFIHCYGVNYIGHPRLEKLLQHNHISAKDFLRGADEAEAFTNKEYIKLHRSTLRKVDTLANLLNRAIDNKLKVKSRWYEIYGHSPQSIYEYLSGKLWFQIIWTIIAALFGAFLSRL